MLVREYRCPRKALVAAATIAERLRTDLVPASTPAASTMVSTFGAAVTATTVLDGTVLDRERGSRYLYGLV